MVVLYKNQQSTLTRSINIDQLKRICPDRYARQTKTKLDPTI